MRHGFVRLIIRVYIPYRQALPLERLSAVFVDFLKSIKKKHSLTESTTIKQHTLAGH